MEYKISDFKVRDVIFEKHMESNGFFRNVSGSSKVGEIAFLDFTEKGIKNYFTENDKVYYMELGSVKGLDFPYRGEAPLISIGDKKHNIPVEDRIKFIYESLGSHTNYNSLGVISINPVLGVRISLFKIIKWDFLFEDSIAFFIKDLNKV